ncbi:PilN domain-containing protein [Agarivorans sp. MS3-6]|uniref:PilN domain-containing protein n=1 Tax=Agarivorans sp. TSD2052 TaxID=2937286 RepID=UPI00201036B8|nr:PilN domain-containing protein [Agarivorans sp. TSD2052]UPW18008.1 PilN domain-containing protein [Agarivorans sp. TSD2052]
MKTRINLYTEEFRPKPELVSLRQVMLSWVLIAVVALVWGIWQQNQSDSAVFKASQQRKLVKQQEAELAKLKTAIEQRAVDVNLQRELDVLQQEVKLKRLLNQRLQGQNYANQGFSSSLTALASIPNEQIWLTEIQIQRGKMALTGQSSRSDAVPKWLKQFQAYPELSNQQFAGLKIYRDEQQQLNFSLSGSHSADVVLGGLDD